MASLTRFNGIDTLPTADQYSGCGGTMRGALYVEGVEEYFGANHDQDAHNSYVANYPNGSHWLGDVQKEDAIYKFPYCPLFLSTPACPDFTDAKGVKRSFDKENQMALWTHPDDMTQEKARAIRSRALMEEVVTYLRHCQEHYGKPVLGFMVENVVQARLWAHWDRWISEIRQLGYNPHVISINAMHVQPRRALWSMQSRNRMLIAAVHECVGRDIDLRKWLDPHAYCPKHDGWIQAVKAWKTRGVDVGKYGDNGQYVYVCPLLSCGGQRVEPPVMPASECIDWTDLGTPIGDRPKTAKKPEGLAPATIERIRAGIRKHWLNTQEAEQEEPTLITTAGGSWNDDAYPADKPMRTITTKENTALVNPPPLSVPCEGRPGKTAVPVTKPIRTQTTRQETGLALPPSFVLMNRSVNRVRTYDPATDPAPTIVANGSGSAVVTPPGAEPLTVPLNGGGDKFRARRADRDPVPTIRAAGNHDGLLVHPASFVMRNNGSKGDGGEHCTPVAEELRSITTKAHQSLVTPPEPLVVTYHGNGDAGTIWEPLGTQTTRDRFGLLTSDGRIDVANVLFRMFKVPEVKRAQCFPEEFILTPKANDRRVKLIGNAVPPPMAEVVVAAIVEAIFGTELERFPEGCPLPI